MMQGMYAGTAEKEKTRDTYHGYVFPAITRQDRRPPPAKSMTPPRTVLEKAQRDIWETWPAMWAFAPKAVWPTAAACAASISAPTTPTTSPTSGWRPES